LSASVKDSSWRSEEDALKLLPKEQWQLEISKDGEDLVCGIYVTKTDVVWWVSFPLWDLPDDLISAEDLEHAGIACRVDVATVQQPRGASA
jgi:hypothetical protein